MSEKYSSTQFLSHHAKPYLGVIFIQFCSSIMSIITKIALTQGMSQHVLVAYRMVVATSLIAPFAIVLERKTRPKMTLRIFAKIALLGLFEPVIGQNLYFTGLKCSTATFTVAMCNILPALTFLMAWIFRLEKVKTKSMRSQAKILGTIVTAGGAMCMTLLKGPILEFPWKQVRILHNQLETGTHNKEEHMTKGALMIAAGCFSWSCFIILQAFLLKSYPAELSLTALMCFVSSVEGTILALAIERGNTGIWLLHFDAKLLSVLYGGFVSCTAYFIMGWLMKKKGPIFVSSFNPLSMVIIAILGSFFIAEELFLGRIVGAIIIVIGLYTVLWGRRKDQPPSNSFINEETLFDQQIERYTNIKRLKQVKILHNQLETGTHIKEEHMTNGALMIAAGCFSWSCFIILQAFLLKSYPAELSLTALMCFVSSVEGTILASAIERGNTGIWLLHFDAKLLAVLYGGFVSCTAYFIMGWLMKRKGSVFVSSFNPLSMVIIAILGSFFIAEELFLGRIVGAIVIVIGLYMVLWGRSKDQSPSGLETLS